MMAERVLPNDKQLCSWGHGTISFSQKVGDFTASSGYETKQGTHTHTGTQL